jgi:hypothetical protein
LVRGERVEIPAYLAPYFERTILAEPVGQTDDWALSLPNGSRVHLQAIDGVLLAHLDKIDPAANPLRHFFAESATGRGIIFGIILTLLIALIEES